MGDELSIAHIIAITWWWFDDRGERCVESGAVRVCGLCGVCRVVGGEDRGRADEERERRMHAGRRAESRA